MAISNQFHATRLTLAEKLTTYWGGQGALGQQNQLMTNIHEDGLKYTKMVKNTGKNNFPAPKTDHCV